MKSILNACLLFATVFFVGQLRYYYHRLLCHSLVLKNSYELLAASQEILYYARSS